MACPNGVYLLLLLGAAVWPRARQRPVAAARPELAVVIPAHDEELNVSAAVSSVFAADYPAERLRVVVIADNCLDRTSEVAQAAGAEVWEREDRDHRGKGYALDWAFQRLLRERAVQAVCVIDADCEVSANLLIELADALGRGADAVQAAYLVSNPEASNSAALRWAGFALMNVVKPRGRSRLGLSSGLLGTGMAFSRDLLRRSPWRAFSYAEDREQHMRWMLHGAKVMFAENASVHSPAPGTRAGRRAQEARWESGKVALVRNMTPRLLARWLRTGELAALDAALEPFQLPQSLLLAANVVAVASAGVSGSTKLRRTAAASLLAQVGYVLGGLLVLRAPASVWRALALLPGFLVRRLALLGRAVMGRGPLGWERTPRGSGRSDGSVETA
jgi:cellulose synthase/poly-beta-1,6-N-acetylglucosamine synthase-like glycosyltransferase